MKIDNDIFISYAQPDRIEALAIHDKFQADKMKSWIAPSEDHGIPIGKYFGGSIVEAIKSSKVFVLVFSKYSNGSQHIINEVVQAVKGGKIIIVLRLDNSEYNNELSYDLESKQSLDGSVNNWDDTLNILHYKVKKNLSSFEPGKYESTDKSLLSNGKKLLENKMYAEAEKELKQYMRIEPNNSFVRFALVLSIIKGRKIKKLDMLLVEGLEGILLPFINKSENGDIRFLLAFIKYGYYTLNGMRQTSPTTDELLYGAVLSKENAPMIMLHLDETEYREWIKLIGFYNS
jgi:hypothetical protein